MLQVTSKEERFMELELPLTSLETLIINQLKNLFLCNKVEAESIKKLIPNAIIASEFCFSHSKSTYYFKNENVFFNPFHSGQYAIFHYYLSHILSKHFESNKLLADKVYYLNKTLNSVEFFYEVKLPAIFFADHPIGSVMGRANYGDFFSFAQNCTVGNNKGIYPEIGKNVRLAAGSTILGNCKIGDNVIISANSYVKDTDIPDCSIVFGTYPNLVIKKKNVEYFKSPIVNYKGYNNWD